MTVTGVGSAGLSYDEADMFRTCPHDGTGLRHVSNATDPEIFDMSRGGRRVFYCPTCFRVVKAEDSVLSWVAAKPGWAR